MTNAFAKEIERVNRVCAPALAGRVVDVTGLTVIVAGLPAPIGTMCRIRRRHDAPVAAQVVGFRDDRTVLMPLSDTLGIARGNDVTAVPGEACVAVGEGLIGRVIDGMGRVIDDGPEVYCDQQYPLYRSAPKALDRPRITEPLATGIRAMDALLTAGRGQRLGLFAGTGVGKSVLLGMIARYTDADVTVLALTGERGREVNDFVEKDLGPEGRRKTVLVVSTSDESPVVRVRASFLAMAVAEYFRDRGRNVLLLMDSLTRVAMAQRQIGLAAGEPPATKGYTPSAFALLPQLLERGGRTDRGSITGFYTVLVEGDDITDPVGDAVRGTLDGHVWLDRALANKAHYPAIGITESISRVMPDVVDETHLRAARTVVRAMAVWNEIEDLVNIGAYAPGSNPEYDTVIQTRSVVEKFLQQRIEEGVACSDSRRELLVVAQQIEESMQRNAKKNGTPELAAVPAA
jgi:FliI/YscN family ATPase